MKVHKSRCPQIPSSVIAALAACAMLILIFAPHSARAAALLVPESPPEFGGQCAEALANGQHVMTNCSSSWTDKDGKKYCFSNDSSKRSFLQSPAENIRRSREYAAASSVE
jgi:YHS domain-containing protein